MRTKLLGGAALLLVLSSGVYAQTMSSTACPAGTARVASSETIGSNQAPKLAEAEGQGKGPRLADSEGQGKGPKLADSEGQGKGPQLAEAEGQGKGPRLASAAQPCQ